VVVRVGVGVGVGFETQNFSQASLDNNSKEFKVNVREEGQPSNVLKQCLSLLDDVYTQQFLMTVSDSLLGDGGGLMDSGTV
jgi:hypothetical protein